MKIFCDDKCILAEKTADVEDFLRDKGRFVFRRENRKSPSSRAG
ncbi:hypothetical protein HMPREF7215_0415 [Pyramidobacter piscolens W5455]|uniref:Uncharacterized protein n=1 Tax=Pyramidobacter piscolens W5455 TaxID=352165 RepID=A0ABM9ZYJ0_9BACT|nr:hypothetical protein HMPREF7215_0415 [Pyramidobacter piscolens W5455]